MIGWNKFKGDSRYSFKQGLISQCDNKRLIPIIRLSKKAKKSFDNIYCKDLAISLI